MTDNSSSETNPTGRPRVVVGVDGSDESKGALRWAAQIAAGIGAEIDAVIAWDYPYTWGGNGIPVAWDPRADMEKVLTGTVEDVFGANPPAHLHLQIGEGNAAKVLLDASTDAAMLVVGSRGHGGFAGMLLGSVSANVAEHATCPVLVVHGDQSPEPIKR
jgi:nucleotide-binding universal stress UspA family protein